MANHSHSDVSNCVASIIHAFTDGFAVFRRLREKRRKKKSRRAGADVSTQPDARAGEELRLSNSLRKGPADIQHQYERNYGVVGERFAKGDAIAHASLAETLLKLNTGLVGIIASFLNHDRKDNPHLDYKSLTNLSDASRAEAIDSLNQLYQRLSQSNVALYQPKPGCPRCGSLKHTNCGAVATRGGNNSEKSRKKPGGSKAGSTTTNRSHSNTPTITRVPVKSSSQTQLAIVRPRNRRTGSTSSTNSAIPSTRSPSNATTAVNTPISSPLASPEYRKVDPFAYQVPLRPREQPSSKPAATSRRKPTAPAQRPEAWPNARPEPAPVPSLSPSPTWKPLAVPRRLDKATPSAYSFASDSTKLGEIPMRNWTVPFDFEASERLNEEALARGWPVEPREEKEKPKRRLFGFLRRGSGDE